MQDVASDRHWLSPAPAPMKTGEKGHDADGSQDAAEDDACTPRVRHRKTEEEAHASTDARSLRRGLSAA